MAGADTPGTIYLLHYTARTKRGRQHYLGWSQNPVKRLVRHRSGYGASETRRAAAEGAKLIMAQTWDGTPALERKLKEWSRRNRVGFAGLCPVCDDGAPLPPDLAEALGPGSMKRIYDSTST